MSPKKQNKNKHIPVLLTQTIEYLAPHQGESYLDLTAGYGGHAAAVLELTKNPQSSVLIDRDQEAVSILGDQFRETGITILQSDFYSASLDLQKQNRTFDIILADLGLSSPHLNIASRGFSFMLDGPLDMRMDQTQLLDAYTIVNSYSENKLAGLITLYGEDPKARKIAHAIVSHRPIHSTNELATIVAHQWPGHHSVHPATRTFQALRIAVNDELGLIERSLPIWLDSLLRPEGRIAVISFHSLEDRLVKQALQDRSGNTYDADLKLLTKQPVTSDAQEIVFNPRARSAKLRAAVKIKK